tara:strand:- start:5280 stop:6206 length:927 start_codon:yes stop_codon:yes gene_type:complete
MKVHKSVLLNETVDKLVMNENGIYVDGTIGFAGHSSKIISKLKKNGKLIGIDLDPYALEYSNKRLSKFPKKSYSLYKGNFSEFPNIIQKIGITKIDGLVVDLGISSYQIDSKHRGFSYRFNSDLDMRFNPENGISAKDLLANMQESELEHIIKFYGEEKQYKKIAKNIYKKILKNNMKTTFDLKDAIESVASKRYLAKTLSRVFQSIRIAVNNEFEHLELFLKNSLKYVRSGGRIAIITFHSIEDKIVKSFFKKNSISCICPHTFPICVCNNKAKLKIINKKAIVPSKSELTSNPRSRSAKLRVVECL